MLFFFFFKQKTAYEMRISDWSSDVCSSDLWAAFDDPPSLTREGEHPRNFVNTLDNVMKKSFWEAGHRPTLIDAFLYFDLAFMAWVLLGPLGVAFSAALGLSPAPTGLVVDSPTLYGALRGGVNGLPAERVGQHREGTS